MKKISQKLSILFLSGIAVAQVPNLTLNGNNITFAGAGKQVAAIQFTAAPASTTYTVPTSFANIKSIMCGPTGICLFIGLNQTVIPDGVIATASGPITLSNIIGADPNGLAVSIVQPAGPCDVNKDGKIDVNDFSAAVNLVNSGGTLDLNQDGKSDLLDVFRVILSILGGGPAACRVGP